MKKKLSRSYIHAKVYPLSKRMSKGNIRKNFWDFYALELLRAKSKSINDYCWQNRIESLLREAATTLLKEQVMALEASIRGEIRYFIRACKSRHGMNDACEVSDFLKSTYCSKNPVTLDLKTIVALFEKNVWQSDFGGSSWAWATRTLIKAKEALQSNNLTDIVFYVDSIFDIHHNNGFVLNKTNFVTLKEEILDIRNGIEDLDTFLDDYEFDIRLSPTVKREIESFLQGQKKSKAKKKVA